MVLELLFSAMASIGPNEPSRILLSWPDSPATSAAVSWRTETELPTSEGEIAIPTPDPAFGKQASKVPAKMTPVQHDGTTSYYYTVHFRNLKPETQYAYRVGSTGAQSEWIQFKTASARTKPFSFIYFGDAQNDIKSLWSRCIRQAFKQNANAAFMIHAGDLINTTNSDKEWAEWFYAGSFLHAMVPSVTVPGNHEYSKGALSIFWEPQFENPRNGIPSLPDSNYFFDYQGVRFLALNSNREIEAQAKWMEQVLKNNKNRWVIAIFHHPVYSTAANRDNPTIRKHWKPVLEKHRVALVLQGHDHTYGRVNVPTGVTARDEEAGTVYVVSVSGPKMYRLGLGAKEWMHRVGESKQLFQIIHVDGNTISYEARTATGELFDKFAIEKTRDGKNRFVAPGRP